MTPAARIAVPTAAIFGLLFPVLETLRRGFGAWLERPVTMLEDYVAGGLLLAAAGMLGRGRPLGWPLMLGASAYTTGMMSSSFWNQLEAQLTGVVWEEGQGLVVAIKAILWAAPLGLGVLSAKVLLNGRQGASAASAA